MSKRDWRLFIEDMLESIDLIEKYTAQLNLDSFKKDRKTIDAVVRNFEVIGEASKFIPDEIKGKYSEIDWPAILGLRNRIAHEYFGISLAIIWTIIKDELPRLKSQLKNML
jgi:uncharacterized protein with HEPN domain